METCLNVVVKVYKGEGYYIGSEIYIDGWCDPVKIMQSIKDNGNLIIEKAVNHPFPITGGGLRVLIAIKDNVVIGISKIGFEFSDIPTGTIEDVVCGVFDIPCKSIRNLTRKEDICIPRHVYYVCCIALTKLSFKEMSAQLLQNYATVTHAKKNVKCLIETGDLRLFKKVKKLDKIFGIDIYETAREKQY